MVANCYLSFFTFFFQDTTTTSGKGFLAIDNNALSTKSCTYYNNNKKLESNSTNDSFLLFIKIFGVVDISISFLYIDVCMYVGQILSNRVTNTCHVSLCPERIKVMKMSIWFRLWNQHPFLEFYDSDLSIFLIVKLMLYESQTNEMFLGSLCIRMSILI